MEWRHKMEIHYMATGEYPRCQISHCISLTHQLKRVLLQSCYELSRQYSMHILKAVLLRTMQWSHSHIQPLICVKAIILIYKRVTIGCADCNTFDSLCGENTKETYFCSHFREFNTFLHDLGRTACCWWNLVHKGKVWKLVHTGF